MKNLKLIFIALSVVTLFFNVLADERALNSAENRGQIGVYRVSADARELLVKMQATVRHGRINGDFIAELSPDQVEILISSGLTVIKLYNSPAEEDMHIRAQEEFRQFHTYTQIINGMNQYAAAYPNIAQVLNLGNSVQGRELLAVKITDNPSLEEDEPEVVFWGNIHGNEYAAAEMPYMYMIYLCDNYGILPEVTNWVNNTEIWCVPMINPDGKVNGTRNNANNIDLNREFGYNWDGWGGSPYPFSQVESRAVRDLALMNNISLSISYHCSGDEFYYPWGYFPSNAPDYLVLTRVGQRYANAASYAMMSSFQSYQTHGEILDWAYGCLGGLSYTAEISNSSAQVQTTFDRNRPGMNMYLNFAAEGLHGTVTDQSTGEPLYAMITIAGNPIPGYTDPVLGDFHRVVLPGTYNLQVWANGYAAQSVPGVTVTMGNPGEFTAALQPDGGKYAFMVASANQEDPNNAYNNITYPAWSLGEPDNLPCSLGANGFIVLDMGAGNEIVDGPGNDFTVTEAVHPRDPNPENFRVYAGDAYVQNQQIGTGLGTTSFDLNGSGVTSTRYLKIVDQSGASPNLPLAGMDLDGVSIINGSFTSSQDLALVPVMPVDFDFTISPNPFNSSTLISFTINQALPVKLVVYDVLGREIQDLGFRIWDLGENEVVWDASQYSSGVYLISLESNQQKQMQKVILLK